MSKNIRNIDEILTSFKLESLTKRASSIYQLDQYLKSKLAKEFTSYYRVANIKDSVLVIEVTNATIATNFRIQQVNILNHAKIVYPSLTELKININPTIFTASMATILLQ